MHMQAYSVLATVQKSDPAHELAATYSRAGMLSRYGIDCHHPTYHPERLTGTTYLIMRTQQITAAAVPRGGGWSPRGAYESL